MLDESKKLPKIIFGFNEDWEIQNWYVTCTKEATYGLKSGNKWELGDIPEKILEITMAGGTREEIMEKIKPVFNCFIKTSEAVQTITQIIERREKTWDRIKERYFSALSAMIEIPISDFEQTYYAFFTFSKRCPFSENKFMFSRFNDFSNAASHEIMHIEFLKAYKKHCEKQGLSELQISHLKEILTVLLNEDMKELLYHPDYAYEKHKEIREEVLKMYQEHKKKNSNFIDFLDRVILEIKKTF